MRALEETQTRWRVTQDQSGGLADLQRAVKYNSTESPCASGCRSVCWKTFLLFKDSGANWQHILAEARKHYGELSDRFLKFIRHPEDLAKLAVDPLADDPDSPWDAVRHDEIVRAEIQQDVQRLPDEANYHEPRIQTMILDILFVYCKTNPNRGGYRQGMHELLAPIVHVIEQDAIDRAAAGGDPSLDGSMLDMLDAAYIEHDAYILFAHLMEQAQVFYQVNESGVQTPNLQQTARLQDQSSAIVERSRFIHEVCLQKIDPELAAHLTAIEILPQIFLIRWIRLLFSREFPFEQVLGLWDTIFAVDPMLDVIDLICVAMLVRIRWQLLEADYSVCLQLLLKYPAPIEPHGPHTFVDDAAYLKSHLTASGGASLIMKYTGRMPATTKPQDDSRPITPNFGAFASLRQRSLGAASPSRFVQQPGSVEALFQGAAKGARGVLERGEKLGINQAVREAMGEIRKNMQGFNEARIQTGSPRDILHDQGPAKAVVAMERRNRQLATMLNETVASLKSVSESTFKEDSKAKSLELIEVAAAKIQFVQIYLEDATMDLPTSEQARDATPAQLTPGEGDAGVERKEGQEQVEHTSKQADAYVSTLSMADHPKAEPSNTNSTQHEDTDKMDTSDGDPSADPLGGSDDVPHRPAPVPTRSTLAQSSFSWMLEPEQSKSNAPPTNPSAGLSPPGQQTKKRISNNASRGKNAFLFGEVANEGTGKDPISTDEIFGMQPMQKTGRK